MLGASTHGLLCVSRSPWGSPPPDSLLQVDPMGPAGAPPGLSRLGPLSPAVLGARITHAAGRRLHPWAQNVPNETRGTSRLTVASWLITL